MITIPLSNEDIGKVLLAPSPLWETMSSFGVPMRPYRQTVHAPWVSHARQVLHGFDFAPLVAVPGIGGRCPDYLSPPPDASCSTFRQELERLRAIPPELMIGELQHLLQEERTLFDRLPRCWLSCMTPSAP